MAAVLWGMRAISHLASICVIIFGILAASFWIAGPKIYMLETAVTGIGTVVQNFVRMSTWMDPLRLSSTGGNGFPQDWTVYYWAYWIAWFVATPFFHRPDQRGAHHPRDCAGRTLLRAGRHLHLLRHLPGFSVSISR